MYKRQVNVFGVLDFALVLEDFARRLLHNVHGVLLFFDRAVSQAVESIGVFCDMAADKVCPVVGFQAVCLPAAAGRFPLLEDDC